MRNCTQPRPADHNVKSSVKPVPPPQPYSSAAPYGGPGAPPYMGMPPYGSSVFNGSGIPPYEAPFSGGSAYPYNYGRGLPGGSPYRPLPMSGPPPYSGGSMMGNGGMYGMPPPMMDRYGMGLPPMGPPPMGPRPGFFPDEKPHKKDVTRENDWTCPKCGNVNFSFRTVCNMRKCNTPKPGSQDAKSEKNSKQKMPEGSWKCEKCGNMNYPFRTKCNRQNCGADKPADANEEEMEKKSPSPPAEGNEQVQVQWVLGHVWFGKVQSCRPACSVWKSVISSSVAAVTLPSHELCQLVLSAVVFGLFFGSFYNVRLSLEKFYRLVMFSFIRYCYFVINKPMLEGMSTPNWVASISG